MPLPTMILSSSGDRGLSPFFPFIVNYFSILSKNSTERRMVCEKAVPERLWSVSSLNATGAYMLRALLLKVAGGDARDGSLSH